MKKLIIFLLCIAILGTGGYYGSVKYKKSKDQKKVVDVVPVELMAEPGDMYEYYSGEMSGEVVSSNAQRVYVDTEKLVKTVCVKQGQTVKKGDTILEYDMTVVELELAQKENQVKVIEQNIKMAEKQLEAIKKYRPSEEAPVEPEYPDDIPDDSYEDYEEPEDYPEEEYPDDVYPDGEPELPEDIPELPEEEPEQTEKSETPAVTAAPVTTQPPVETTAPVETTEPAATATTPAETTQPPETTTEPQEEPVETVSLVKAAFIPVSGSGRNDDPYVINCGLDTHVSKTFLQRLAVSHEYAALYVYDEDGSFIFRRMIDPETIDMAAVEDFKASEGVIIDKEQGIVDLDPECTVPGRISFALPKAKEKVTQETEKQTEPETTRAPVTEAPVTTTTTTAEPAPQTTTTTKKTTAPAEEEPVYTDDEIPEYLDTDEDFGDDEWYDDGFEDYYPEDDGGIYYPEENGSGEDIPESFDYVYTRAEIQGLIKEQESEIKQLELELKGAKIEYEDAKKQKSDGKVVAKIDGVVKKIGDAAGESRIDEEGGVDEEYYDDEYISDSDAFAIIEGEGGAEVVCSVSELSLADAAVGSYVTVMSWETGASGIAEITSVDLEPKSYSSENWGENPNNSTYNVHARLDESADFTVGDWLSVTLMGSGDEMSSSVYLPIHYVRQEGGDYYIMKDEGGKLKKQYVKAGKIMYGYYIEIKGGLKMSDKICFPYGTDVKEGIKTKDSTEVLYPEDY